MNLQAIIVANVTGFILIFFLYFSRFITRTKSGVEDKAFDAMMYLGMVGLIVEPITFAVDGIPSAVGYYVNLLGNTYLYFANGSGIFFWLIYVDLMLYHDIDRVKRIYSRVAIPVGILLLSLIGNLYFKYYFYVDENFVYHRKPTIYIFYIYLMICSAYSLVIYHQARLKNGRTAFFPIYMFLVPIVVSSVLQMIFYGISLAWLGLAIGSVALYMSLQQQKAYVDPLTGLYNRLYLAHILFKISSSTAAYYGMMIDLNGFKAINDTYGHSAGDRALTDAARIFAAGVDARSTVFRYAGDEFIIMTKASDEEEIKALSDKLYRAAEDFNDSGKRPYHLGFAIGYGKYDNKNDDMDSFLRKIDYDMYRVKTMQKEADMKVNSSSSCSQRSL
ncbi:GGDEF domain-containing protein [Butyrivibrio sp. MC2013]|uniref:GGDEF domain-containing protein n=1 Tax=Butyrivibrio sp. MC2013 TaxID=1280686 RepID=UPI00041CB358|nr:GGDEF domain-containing protein [Butyrivibrio sp. MC2013]